MKRIFVFLLFLFAKQIVGISQNHVLYGVTSYGGTNGSTGVLFCYIPYTNKYIILDDFNTLTGNLEPIGGSLIQDTITGYIYGMTRLGGGFNRGTIFRYDPKTNIDTVIYSFHTPTGITPLGSLVFASNGFLYGMTSSFNIYDAVFFSFNPKTFLYSNIFNFDTANGADGQYCQPIQATDGKIYGMTPVGGHYNDGVLFRYNPINNQDTVVLFFDSLNGLDPPGSVIQATNGLLYGMTAGGGINNSGVFFSFDPITKKDSVLYNFNSIGSNPGSDMYQASNGILYSIIPPGNYIFSYNPVTGKDTTYYLTHGESFFLNTNNDLVQDPDNGLLYGTTTGGGDSGYGTLFSFDPLTGKDSVFVNFTAVRGINPCGRLLLSKTIPSDTTTTEISTITSKGNCVCIYPNPNKGAFTVSLSQINSKCEVEIYNVLGEKIYQKVINSNNTEINLNGQPQGIYFYRVLKETGELVGSGKLIVE